MDTELLYRHSLLNRLHSLLLLAAMAAFLGLLGWLLWGSDGLVGLLIAGTLMLAVSPTVTPGVIMRMYRARPIRPTEAPDIYGIVQALAERAGLPAAPMLYYVPSQVINAFTVGRREQAAIGVTDGLLRGLDAREAAGVLAHEVAHIRNDDMWVMAMADLFSRGTSLLSIFGQLLLLLNLPLIMFAQASVSWPAIALLIFAPNLSALAQLGLSRTREYHADIGAAELTGDPRGLASALAKIERQQGSALRRVLMPGRGVPDPSLLRTHPVTEERVRRLLELTGTQNVPPLPMAHTGRWSATSRPAVTRVPRRHVTGVWH